VSGNWQLMMPSTEAYWIDRVLFDVQHKPQAMAAFRSDSDAYLKDLPLSPAAKRALVATDVGRLYLAGANPYLLRAHCLNLRMSEDAYLGALRAVAEEAS